MAHTTPNMNVLQSFKGIVLGAIQLCFPDLRGEGVKVEKLNFQSLDFRYLGLEDNLHKV